MQFSLRLDKEAVFSGDTLSGYLALSTLDSDEKVDGIRLNLHGSEDVKWVEEVQDRDEGGRKKLVPIEYEGSSLVCDDKEDIAEEQNITVGSHTFQFSFKLPDKTPGTFSIDSCDEDLARVVEATVGYDIKATPAVGGLYQTARLSQAVTVYERFHGKVHPVESQATHSFPMARGDLLLAARIERNVYFPGENVAVRVEIANGSSYNGKNTSICLRRKLQFNSNWRKTKRDDDLLCSNGPVVSSMEIGRENVEIALPENIHPSVLSGQLIELSYEVVVKVTMKARIPAVVEMVLPLYVCAEQEIEVESRASEDDLIPNGVLHQGVVSSVECSSIRLQLDSESRACVNYQQWRTFFIDVMDAGDESAMLVVTVKADNWIGLRGTLNREPGWLSYLSYDVGGVQLPNSLTWEIKLSVATTPALQAGRWYFSVFGNTFAAKSNFEIHCNVISIEEGEEDGKDHGEETLSSDEIDSGNKSALDIVREFAEETDAIVAATRAGRASDAEHDLAVKDVPIVHEESEYMPALNVTKEDDKESSVDEGPVANEAAPGRVVVSRCKRVPPLPNDKGEKIVTDEIWENQRWGLIGGWSSSNLLPFDMRGAWSDSKGAKCHKDEFFISEGSEYHWKNEWTVYRKPYETDYDGWEYAFSWYSEWHVSAKKSSFVRRRKWLRTRIYTGSDPYGGLTEVEYAAWCAENGIEFIPTDDMQTDDDFGPTPRLSNTESCSGAANNAQSVAKVEPIITRTSPKMGGQTFSNTASLKATSPMLNQSHYHAEVFADDKNSARPSEPGLEKVGDLSLVDMDDPEEIPISTAVPPGNMSTSPVSFSLVRSPTQEKQPDVANGTTEATTEKIEDANTVETTAEDEAGVSSAKKKKKKKKSGKNREDEDENCTTKHGEGNDQVAEPQQPES